jgi:hypothetical protein
MPNFKEGVPAFQEDMAYRHFGDTFYNHTCLGLDATSTVYELPPGNISGGISTQDHFFDGCTKCTNLDIFHGGSFGNTSGVDYQHSAPQQQIAGHATLHHPYHYLEPRDQTALPSDPHKYNMQQPTLRDKSGDTTQFGGGHATLHNHYQHSVHQQTARHATIHHPYHHFESRDQTQFPSNAYTNDLQQSQNFHCIDNPPMQEVVVQNNSVRSGLGGDDTSQFEDAFL